MNDAIANCPQCHHFRSVQLTHHHVSCRHCPFEAHILCPYCDIGQLRADTELQCQSCQRTVPHDLLAYILKNRLAIDTAHRCQYCHNPTLSKPSANITSRCFDHPTCGQQSALFATNITTQDYVFLDFETTGLDIGNESIIELGACRVDASGKEYFFNEFIKPVGDIKPLITNITGITNDMVQHAPSLREVLTDFRAFSDGACLVAHNAPFDIPWLLTSLLRFDIDIPYTELICTLKWAKTKEDGKRSLGALSKKYQIGHENAHRALADAVVTKRLFDIYVNQGDDKPVESIDRYLDMSKKIISQYPHFIQP